MSLVNSIKKFGHLIVSLAQSPSETSAIESSTIESSTSERLEQYNNDETFDKRSDNFLRGEMVNARQRRQSIEADRVGISYWRHAAGCSCCRDTNKYADPSQQDQRLSQKAARASYINLPNQGLGLELSCLSSFITNSGQFSVYKKEDDVTSETAKTTGEWNQVSYDNKRNHLARLIDLKKPKSPNSAENDERSVA